jgi:UDP-GlcNAc:undecaprenyl-phosphate GlcNAc-1-phosphate transferase
LALGFLMGVAALDGFVALPNTTFRVVIPILCTAVPLFELVFITSVRARKGLPWWKGSPDHFALRLQRAGLSKSLIDILATGLSVALWFCGMALARMPGLSGLLFLVSMLTGLAVCWRLLLLWEV